VKSWGEDDFDTPQGVAAVPNKDDIQRASLISDYEEVRQYAASPDLTIHQQDPASKTSLKKGAFLEDGEKLMGFKDTPFESSHSNREMMRFESKKRLPEVADAIGEEIHEITDENGEDRIESMSHSAKKNDDFFKNIMDPLVEPNRKHSEFSARPITS
jgi:hypothetical protein